MESVIRTNMWNSALIINKYQKKNWTGNAALGNPTLDWNVLWCFIINPDSLDTIKKEDTVTFQLVTQFRLDDRIKRFLKICISYIDRVSSFCFKLQR